MQMEEELKECVFEPRIIKNKKYNYVESKYK